MFKKGHPPYLLHHTEETKIKISIAHTKPRFSINCLFCKKDLLVPKWNLKRKKYCSKICLYAIRRTGRKKYIKKGYSSGKNHYAWIKDRNTINKDERNNADYLLWVRKIKKRDNYFCKINNNDCNGRLEAHHILGWSSHPELRYEINNGITLCHAHHPKKRAEEQLLVPTFQELISQMN